MIKKGIGSKILGSYFLLIFIIFISTNILFGFLMKRYLINELKQQMATEALSIEKIIDAMDNNATSLWIEDLALRRQLRMLGNIVQSNIVITTAEPPVKVLFTNVPEEERKETMALMRSQALTQRHVVYQHTLYSQKEPIAKIILFSKLEDLQALNQLMRRTQILSMTIAGLLSVVLAIFIERKITKPIKWLEKSVLQYELGQSYSFVPIESGDEIETLSANFQALLTKIENYDHLQKTMMQNTSHELKTPIMSIQGYAEGILDGVLVGEEAEQGLHVIVSESKRLKKTIDEVLFLSKIESQSNILQLAIVDVEELIQMAIRAVKPLADDKNIKIIWSKNITSDLEWWLDGEKILRCLINLLGNAVRYAAHEIHLETDSDVGLKIRVIDDGPGFSDKDLAQGFNRFYKGEHGGTGLGLTISKAIIEAHSGKIELKKAPINGALVEITIPSKNIMKI